jgi:superfamily I DNA/RNA helicase
MMERDDELEYLKILKALREIPFDTGKNLLADFLMGDYKNKSIIKNRLDELRNFGVLSWEKDKILSEIDNLIVNGMIDLTTSDYNRFVKILRITIKGQNEIVHPTLSGKKLKNKVNFDIKKIDERDISLFKQHEEFLRRFNDEQKKAIVSSSDKILCIAGAGSGKTSVLIKRIEFLIRYRNVTEEKILAITFTRKAKQEMEKRLLDLNIKNVNVHTFNSFCENILRKHQMRIYGRSIRVLNYQDKIFAINLALLNIGMDMETAINQYYSYKQRENKTMQQLMNSFINDCFSVIEYFKITGIEDFNISTFADASDKANAKMIYEINKFIREHMNIQGLRDFSDQLIDSLRFFEQESSAVPQYDHVLVDEYQDVNAMQVRLLKLLKSKNIFAVGDPRQAIFGWRGSDIKFILNFSQDHGENEIISLSKNYRSSKKIVHLMNHSIKELGMPDLVHVREKNADIKLIGFDSEEEEREYILKKILEDEKEREEIFVLARTNRQLMEMSKIMKLAEIPHLVKTDEVNGNVEGEGLTLATIHAIKGLQAKKVFVIGCNDQNFPCKASDHPAIEMIKTNDYNRDEEEKRLFYVAISRAKDSLYLTYSGKKPTYFINDEMKKLVF